MNEELRKEKLFASIYQLILESSSKLPADVRALLRLAQSKENQKTNAGLALAKISENINLAEESELPLCQDTGLPTFKIKTPINFNQLELKELIERAVVRATEQGKLRTNSVDSLTGKNTGNNLGQGTPAFSFEQWEREDLEIKLLLKGGGCENKNRQYSLPQDLGSLGRAGRDLDGVRKCILDAVYQAQGQGCSAGFLGVSIGGDRTTGYMQAKEQLFRDLRDQNPNKELAQLEEYLLEKANTLGIGTMGFGGEVTLLGCKIGVQNRIPASFFVSVAYNCWAFRRQAYLIENKTGEIKEKYYQETTLEKPAEKTTKVPKTILLQTKENKKDKKISLLEAPVSEEEIRKLRVGDLVLIKGNLITGRDAVHSYLSKQENDSPINLEGELIYHCGPVAVKQADESWKIKAAGPTTSIREEPYQAEIIQRYKLRGVIGKGGMGAQTLKALQDHGAVYLNAIGGAAQYYSQCIKRVKSVKLLQFGIPEAMWFLEVADFPAIVTMDSTGNSLHKEIEQSSLEKLAQFKERVFS